jgi:hypothetical protein
MGVTMEGETCILDTATSHTLVEITKPFSGEAMLRQLLRGSCFSFYAPL